MAITSVLIIYGCIFLRDWWSYQPANVESIIKTSTNDCIKEELKNPASEYLGMVLINYGKGYWTNGAVRVLKAVCEDRKTAQQQRDAVTP